jgi:vesicle-associated membrane protein 7
MTILYALVARSKTVLAEYTFTSGNFPTITRVLLGKIDDKDGKMSYVYDQHVFHYIVENHIIYMCMCDDHDKRRVPFGFLEDMKARFHSTYGQRAQTAIAFAMSEDFSRVMCKQMDFYNGTAADSFSQVNTKLDDVKNIMVQNIEMVLERGEKLELLVDKTEQLQSQAFKFEKSSKELKLAMFWKRVKLYALIGFIVVFILWLLTSIICGFDYKSC